MRAFVSGLNGTKFIRALCVFLPVPVDGFLRHINHLGYNAFLIRTAMNVIKIQQVLDMQFALKLPLMRKPAIQKKL